MAELFKVLTKRFPRNFIIANPFWGSFVIMAFCILFAILYKPLGTHESRYFNYPVTMLIYCSLSAVFIYIVIKIINRIPYFSQKKKWTIVKEIISVILVLTGMGIAIYFLAFLMEPPADRWNLSTFFDSWKASFLIGIIPFAFFTLSHYRHLFVEEISSEFPPGAGFSTDTSEKEVKIQIESQLKKEELSFYPHEFIYAESDGNYVAFYIATEQGTQKKLIRNSISNVEQQLELVPYFNRTHRAFIVNVNKIISKQGNSLGYRLKLSGTDAEIPVSRQKIASFDLLLSRYK